MSEINKLKHFDALNYKGEYFTNELEDGIVLELLKIQKLLYLKKVDLLEILV